MTYRSRISKLNLWVYLKHPALYAEGMEFAALASEKNTHRIIADRDSSGAWNAHRSVYS